MAHESLSFPYMKTITRKRANLRIRKSVTNSFISVLYLLMAHLAFADPMSQMKADVLITSEEFEISRHDLYMYLRPTTDPVTGELDWGSPERRREGMQQLYALNILRLDAEKNAVLSDEEKKWIAEYEVSMAMVRQYLAKQVALEADEIDFNRLAQEYYLANREEFMLPERLTLRTLLIRTDCRTPEEAVEMAAKLVSDVRDEAEFEAVIKQHTEDEVAAETGGLMSSVTRGQTVVEFEEAAFALTEPGEFSQPVVSEFGAHVIQLISRKPAFQQPFEDVQHKIIAELEGKERSNILSTLRMEARERRPEGLVVNTEALNAFVNGE